MIWNALFTEALYSESMFLEIWTLEPLALTGSQESNTRNSVAESPGLPVYEL